MKLFHLKWDFLSQKRLINNTYGVNIHIIVDEKKAMEKLNLSFYCGSSDSQKAYCSLSK